MINETETVASSCFWARGSHSSTFLTRYASGLALLPGPPVLATTLSYLLN